MGTCSTALKTAGKRGGNKVVLKRGHYDYAPTVMHDGKYRMWWCGGVAGDHILYAEASTQSGPWSKPRSVLKPTNKSGDFDADHTCDPSVIRVKGRYYMYYGGLGSRDDRKQYSTRIGVASSIDGIRWKRLNGGKPIVIPARRKDQHDLPNKYGAGQPSATYINGKIYLIFTDTTGIGANRHNGAGQFIMRSTDPTFRKGVEELGQNGFRRYSAAKHTAYSRLGAFSVDWMYSDVLEAFVIARPVTGKIIYFLYDRSLRHKLGSVSVAASWREGPGLITRPDGHAMPGSSCGRVPLDVMRAVGGKSTKSWDLSYVGTDLDSGLSCKCVDHAAVYDGSLISGSGLPLTFITGGKRLQLASWTPAKRLARSHYRVSRSTFHMIPFGASLHLGATVLGAKGRPPAFKLNGNRLWPTSCLSLITSNKSKISYVSRSEWNAQPRGPSLYCIK